MFGTTGHRHSLIRIEAVRQNNITAAHVAEENVHACSLLAATVALRSYNPDAAYLHAEPSDQGPHLIPWSYEDVHGDEHDLDEDLDGQLADYLGTVVDEPWAEELWLPFHTPDPAVVGCGSRYRFHLDLILEHEGRGRALTHRRSLARA